MMETPIPIFLPPSWDEKVWGIKVTVAGLDDLGFPSSRRSGEFVVPRDVRNHGDYAREIGRMVEQTVRATLGMTVEENGEQS